MASLKEFLAEQAEKLKDEESETARIRDEWVASVDRLNERIKDWIREADPNRILQIDEQPVRLREEGIGGYEIRGLTIGLGKREVRIKPVARNVAGPLSATGVIHINRAYGRVDMTNGLEKHMIFRLEKEPEDRWSIIEQDGYRIQSLDQSSFESTLQNLFE